MDFPFCQTTHCPNEALFFLPDKRQYICLLHKGAQAEDPEDGECFDQEAVRLVSKEEIKMLLSVIKRCRKELQLALQKQGDLAPEEEFSALDSTIEEMSSTIIMKLEDAIREDKFYEFGDLLEETKCLEDLIKNDRLFLKYSSWKAWNEAVRVVEGNPDKSDALALIQLEKKYKKRLSTTVDLLKGQRQAIERRKDKEIDKLSSKLVKKRKKVKDLKAEIDQLKRTHLKEMRGRRQECRAKIREVKDFHREELKEKEKLQNKAIQRLKGNLNHIEEESKHKSGKINDLDDQIFKLSKSMEKLRETNEKIKAEWGPPIEEYSDKEFSLLCRPVNSKFLHSDYPKSNLKSQVNWLSLSLDKTKHLRLVVNLSKRIPDLNRIDIGNVSSAHKWSVKEFMNRFFPKKVGVFCFNINSDLSPIDDYMDELIKISDNVKEELNIYNFEIPQHHLVTLLSRNKSKERFRFFNCKLNLTFVPNFSKALKGCALKRLDFDCCGDASRGNWEHNRLHFDNLIQGLGQCGDLRKSLKELVVTNCGMQDREVTATLERYGFMDVEVWSVM
ncbi:unnamed protein product [Moneuplotes crassus]|uniref:Uncharacterized protein n=1 Tax=Euplotes crassus TaxID=5936 RepID=A0AAD1U2S6_EUPCR|nr:unnamed protein product [Moneuplotes crassus]